MPNITSYARFVEYRRDAHLVHYRGNWHPSLGRDHQLLPPVDFLALLVPHVLLRFQCVIRTYGALSTTVRRRLGWIITLKLVGVKANRAAIGARIVVRVDDPAGPRDIQVPVTSGSSFGGSSLQQEIGLGQATRIRGVRIVWPGSGLVQTLGELEMNRYFEIREGDPEPTGHALKRLRLSPGTEG